MPDINELKVTTKVKLRKYNKGQNINSDLPFEIIEKEITFVGEEAQKIMKTIGVDNNVINK